MKVLLWSLPALFWILPLGAQPVFERLLNFEQIPWPGVAPGGIIVLKGSGFAGESRVAPAPPWPKKLAGARVLVDGVECALLSVSPDTIYAQLPYGIVSTRSSYYVDFKVVNADGESRIMTISLGSAAPMLLRKSHDGQGPAIVLNENLAPALDWKEGDVLVFEAVGLGETDPPATEGMAGRGAEPFQMPRNKVKAFFGEAEAEVLYAGLSPGLAGIYQVKVRVPPAAGQTFKVQVDGFQATAELPRLTQDPVTDVSGEILGDFAVPARPWGFSVIPIGAKISVAMTVSPLGDPFEVVLEGEAARIQIQVKPREGVFEGTAVVPAIPTRFGDFSGTDLRVLDLLAGGNPIPGNIIPASRLDPQVMSAFNGLPAPNEPLPGAANGLVRFSGRIPSDGRLILSSSTAPSITATAGWRAITDLSAKTYVARFRLLVNGQEVASKSVTISVQP